MDATPLTLGQEISGWVQLLDNGLKHVEEVDPAPLRAGPGRNGRRHRA